VSTIVEPEGTVHGGTFIVPLTKGKAIDAGVNFNASLIDISDALEELLEDCLQTIVQIDGLEPDGDHFIREIAIELACEWAD